MVPPIDVSDITSKESAKKAIQTGEITREQAKYIAQAFTEFRENNILLESEDYKIDKDAKEERKNAEREEFLNETDREKTKMIVLKKQVGNNPEAFVIEYTDDGKTPKKIIGKQKFTRDAISELDNKSYGIKKRLPEHKGKSSYQTSLEENFEESLKKNGEEEDTYWMSDGSYIIVGSSLSYSYPVGSEKNKPRFIRLLKD